MSKVKQLKSYAKLISNVGIEASPLQNVLIIAHVEASEFVHYLVSELYKSHVKKVEVIYKDYTLEKLALKNEHKKYIKKIDFWREKRVESLANNNFAIISLVGSDPVVFNHLNDLRREERIKIFREKFAVHLSKYNSNLLSWVEACCPTRDLATLVFPELTPTQALQTMWKIIYESCHMLIPKVNPIKAFREHIARLDTIANKINNLNLKSFRVTTVLGTDLTFEFNEYNFSSLHFFDSEFKHHFFANMPSELIGSCLKNVKVNGHAVSSKDIFYESKNLVGCSIDIVDNKVTVHSNDKDTKYILQSSNFIDVDKIGLVDNSCPLARYNKNFMLHLFNKNSSTHLVIKSKRKDSPEPESEKIGLYSSEKDFIFPIGTDDLTIIGKVKETNEEIIIMKNGKFVD